MKTKITPDPTILRKGLLFWCLSSPPFYHTDICVYIKCIVCVCVSTYRHKCIPLLLLLLLSRFSRVRLCATL